MVDELDKLRTSEYQRQQGRDERAEDKERHESTDTESAHQAEMSAAMKAGVNGKQNELHSLRLGCFRC